MSENKQLLYDAYAALRALFLEYGMDEDYPESAMDTYQRLGDVLFGESNLPPDSSGGKSGEETD